MGLRVWVFAASVLILGLSTILGGCNSSNSANARPDPVGAGVASSSPATGAGATNSNAVATGSPPSANAPPLTPASRLSTFNSGDACLPHAMPTIDVLFNSAKRVFAHYFYPFPLSINDKPSAQDYYNTEYLNKHGESDKWLAQGGYLRQRPLGVTVSSDANWPMMNMEQEISMAIARGITGFAVDVMSLNEASDANSQLHMLLSAAQAVDSRFKIVVMPDITVLGSDADSVVQIVASVAKSPAAYKLRDGRLVVSAFDAGRNSAAWWGSVINTLAARGIHIAFVPTFLGWEANADAFSSISYGFGDWGSATPGASSGMQGDAGAVHNTYGKIYMMPVDPQQFRPKDFLFSEAGNSAAFRNAWNSSILGGADWVQLVTWSDFSETSEVEPYTDASLKRDIGTGYYDLTGFYAAWFLTGKQPTITHDVLYYFYRREPTTAAGPAQSELDHTSSTPEDDIELLAFLTAPGVLKITIGGQTYTQNAPAGITSFKVPLQSGTPVFTLSRDEADVFSFVGGIEIYGDSGIPSSVIDLTYWSGSAAKSGVCSL